MTTATETKSRAALVGDLERLRDEGRERLVPLKADVETAEAHFTEVDRQLDVARAELRAAVAAVSAESSRGHNERGQVEAALHRAAPDSIAEFREWCMGRIERLTGVEPTPENRSQVVAAHGAMQELQRLELLGDDDLERRLGELRAAVGAGA